jgi:hypothetical protein
MGGNVCAGTDARASGATQTADTARMANGGRRR